MRMFFFFTACSACSDVFVSVESSARFGQLVWDVWALFGSVKLVELVELFFFSSFVLLVPAR